MFAKIDCKTNVQFATSKENMLKEDNIFSFCMEIGVQHVKRNIKIISVQWELSTTEIWEVNMKREGQKWTGAKWMWTGYKSIQYERSILS